jgi:hypothetical protein
MRFRIRAEKKFSTALSHDGDVGVIIGRLQPRLGVREPEVARNRTELIDVLTVIPWPAGSQTGVLLLPDNLTAFILRVLSVRAASRTLDLQYYAWEEDVSSHRISADYGWTSGLVLSGAADVIEGGGNVLAKGAAIAAPKDQGRGRTCTRRSTSAFISKRLVGADATCPPTATYGRR